MKAASDGLGRRLRDARSKRGLTMDELAAKAKMTQATISRLEIGQNYPMTITVEKLARALGVDPCWLAYGTGAVPDWDLGDKPAERTDD